LAVRVGVPLYCGGRGLGRRGFFGCYNEGVNLTQQ